MFNFAAYHLGEEEVLKLHWEKARKFVRYEDKTLLGRISQEPFWTGQETSQLRFADDSYNLRIENKNGHVIGVIQIYNLFTYEFILAENYFIPENMEVACRFTPGEEPYLGFKMQKPNFPSM